jgi:hypothetical protein
MELQALQERRHALIPMRMNSLALVVGLVWTTAMPAFAQATSGEHDALVFLDSQVLPKKAAACSARISGFPARFDPEFRSWLARNQRRIVSGEAFLRADSERTQAPFERDVQAVVSGISQQWGAAPLPMLQENCEAMLLQLKGEPDGG